VLELVELVELLELEALELELESGGAAPEGAAAATIPASGLECFTLVDSHT
jgi:hypothetical protein